MIKRQIFFDADLHKYTDEEGKVYTSVTQKIGLVTPVFNTRTEAIKYAARHGNTPEYWEGVWANLRDTACARGNETHGKLEDGIESLYESKSITGTVYSISDVTNCIKRFPISKAEIEASPLKYMFPKIYARIVNYLRAGWTLYAERIVYWYEYLISGTIDLLLIKGKEFIILDWKTNKDALRFESGYYKKVKDAQGTMVKTDEWISKDDRMLKPLNHLQHCKGTIYTLQLSLYALLVELWGFTCKGLELWHIRNGEEFMYEIKYIKNDAILLANYNSKNKSIQPVSKAKFGLK